MFITMCLGYDMMSFNATSPLGKRIPWTALGPCRAEGSSRASSSSTLATGTSVCAYLSNPTPTPLSRHSGSGRIEGRFYQFFPRNFLAGVVSWKRKTVCVLERPATATVSSFVAALPSSSDVSCVCASSKTFTVFFLFWPFSLFQGLYLNQNVR